MKPHFTEPDLWAAPYVLFIGRGDQLKSANQQLEMRVYGAPEALSFLRLSTLFLHSPTPQISLRSWQNQIGVFNPLRSQGLGFTIVRGFSVST